MRGPLQRATREGGKTRGTERERERNTADGRTRDGRRDGETNSAVVLPRRKRERGRDPFVRPLKFQVMRQSREEGRRKKEEEGRGRKKCLKLSFSLSLPFFRAAMIKASLSLSLSPPLTKSGMGWSGGGPSSLSSFLPSFLFPFLAPLSLTPLFSLPVPSLQSSLEHGCCSLSVPTLSCTTPVLTVGEGRKKQKGKEREGERD